MDADTRGEIEALANTYVRDRLIEGRCGVALDAYSQPVHCQREAGHPGNRHEAAGITWVSS